jgi:UDP-N-acetyl-D-glucosamine dehydrogenase
MSKKRIPLQKAKILIMGVTYKKDVKDLRESPALDIISYLRQRKVRVSYFDPLIPYLDMKGLKMKRSAFSPAILRKYDCAVIATDHTAVDYAFLQKQARCIFDARNVYKKKYANVTAL